MAQTFDVRGGPALGRKNLPKLRKRLRAQGLDGFLIPHEDEYQNEYLPAAHERLAWATGFTGSAGLAVALQTRAALFVDGRYTLQASQQVDPGLFDIRALTRDGPGAWLREAVKPDARIGYDPRLHTPDGLRRLAEAVVDAGAVLEPVAANAIDAAWSDRPAAPHAPARPHPLAFAGEAHADKRARLAAGLERAHLDAAVITDPASVAWLLNLRGGDVACTPLPLSRALLWRDGRVTLFIDPDKLDPDTCAHLGEDVAVDDERALAKALAGLSGHRVGVDTSRASAWFVDTLEAAGAIVAAAPDPCALPRAQKNETEIEGARNAHERDGVALARFLHWLAQEAPSGEVDEITAAETLLDFRRLSNAFEDLSFETISGAGPNGAVIHYRVTQKSNRRLKRGSLYLVDSGAQYRDGTTDVTRTIAIGRPKREMRERYTLVLQGHIALAAIRFPQGTTGPQLDALARQFLWNAGLDYDHGTGHGVGSYLGVHEGPQRIHRVMNDVPLTPGMIVSNEPGYYKPGGYGVRVENLQVVAPPTPMAAGEAPMLGFETLTLAPLDRALIVKSMLSKAERAWVDAYHARVAAMIGPRVEAPTRAWLEAACAPL